MKCTPCKLGRFAVTEKISSMANTASAIAEKIFVFFIVFPSFKK